MLELLWFFMVDKRQKHTYNINNSNSSNTMLGGDTYRRSKMIDDRQARETFLREWRVVEDSGKFLDGRAYKSVVWNSLANYWRVECPHITKARRDKIVVWCVERVGKLEEGMSMETFQAVVRGIVDRAILEA